jgi:hypothetical protein
MAQRPRSSEIKVKMICKRFSLFPITLAPLRLGGKNIRFRCLPIADHLRRPRSVVVRSTQSSENFIKKSFLCALCGPPIFNDRRPETVDRRSPVFDLPPGTRSPRRHGVRRVRSISFQELFTPRPQRLGGESWF